MFSRPVRGHWSLGRCPIVSEQSSGTFALPRISLPKMKAVCWKVKRKDVIYSIPTNINTIVQTGNKVCNERQSRLLSWAIKVREASSFLRFPRTSIFILVAYVILFSIQYVLVTASQKAGTYSYNTTLVVFITESLKLLIATGFLLKEYVPNELFLLFRKYWTVPLLYILPSALYCLSNNLMFFNLQSFDPTTYNVLLQLRIVLTGILFQILFKRTLSRIQWLALIVLTCGCVVKQLGAGGPRGGMLDSLRQFIDWDGLLLLAQMLCSCLAGVLNELFLKDDTGPAMFNNFCMYSTSVIANLIVIAVRGSLHDIVDPTQLRQIFYEPLVLSIIVNGAISGMMIPLFLCYFNSIARVFTVSVELTLLALICWAVFGTPFDLVTLFTIIIVSVATFVYVKNPVVTDSCYDDCCDGAIEKKIPHLDFENSRNYRSKADSIVNDEKPYVIVTKFNLPKSTGLFLPTRTGNLTSHSNQIWLDCKIK